MAIPRRPSATLLLMQEKEESVYDGGEFHMRYIPKEILGK